MTAILRIGVVAEGADQVPHVVHAAGDLLHRRVVDLAISCRERLLDRADHDVGVGVGGGEDQRLAGKGRVDVVRQFLGDHTIELRRDHLLVELLDLEADFVGRMGEIDFAGPSCSEGRAARPSRNMMPARASAVSMRTGGSWSIR